MTSEYEKHIAQWPLARFAPTTPGELMAVQLFTDIMLGNGIGGFTERVEAQWITAINIHLKLCAIEQKRFEQASNPQATLPLPVETPATPAKAR